MKNFIFIGMCAFIFGLGMSACKSKIAVKSEGDFSLIVDKKWTLSEINGVALSSMNPQPATESFIIFQVTDNRVSGSSGCNNFTGSYKLGPGTTLQFSGVASTRKMCLDMTIENQMNNLFQTVDSYTLQGRNLSLKQAKTTLARFVIP